MALFDRRNVLSLATAGAVTALLPKTVAAGMTNTGLFTSDDAGLLVDSVLIAGDKSALLVDAQFTAANANALADMVTGSGRKLETIVITHFHPDHFFGLPILLERFPDAVAVAHPVVQSAIAAAAQPMWDRIAGQAPDGVFADKVIIPEAISADHLMLEGERIELLGPMHGDTAAITPVYVPALDTLITSDVAYVDTHLWLAENAKPDQVQAWRESIAELKTLGASTVIPGHRKAVSPNDDSVFDATLDYLDHWEAAIAESSNAEDLKAALVQGREDYGFPFAVDRSVDAIFPQK
jgi:glyoxylase-like metal-dependent hydrolase (beta-lactamase superfamily II)